ncbi:L-2-hydroxyglutarate oxidase [Acidimicrobiaceae bacterium]|nr:L-2-hydroxyglutarate oxidase [Acidimicrobiaceae bacterium]MDA9712866.1 L-2-hydroxyglutarate oxidase [Acidimicrobiaceae bacterium]
MNLNNTYDYAVIGAGIVGLSTALHLQKQNVSVVVLEKEKEPGLHQSGRNSGVIHSGIYYKPNSSKSELSIKGRNLLVEYLQKKNINFRQEGKIVVDNDLDKLESLLERSIDLEMEGVKIVQNDELLSIEPNSVMLNGLFVPQAGVVDYKEVVQAYANDFIEMGGEIKYIEEIKEIENKNGLKSISGNKYTYNSEFLINCAGLFSDEIAKLDNMSPNVKIIPFRGEYYKISNTKNNILNNMIYPLADPDLPFLGIHLTKTANGDIEAGPNAVLAFSKEGYKWTDINFVDLTKVLTFPGMLKLGKKYFRTGISEMYRSLNKNIFVKEIQKLINGVNLKDIKQIPSGVRAQAVDKDGNLVDDFLFEEGENSLHVLNSPSPAATASLAIGESIVSKILN